MKQFFAYIRVSDPKQGKGVSLAEQRSIIEGYAGRIDALIVEWFVETRTAAKAGRPVFSRMLKLVRAGKAEGIIVHKLDRSTRNYYDWAEINALIDNGIAVHVASENLDLRSRGGMLAADMQVLIAVDYIRNLREEALKGIHGRLKQGILPNAAPIGYLNRGKGNAKEIDPVKGPLVKHLFEAYATGALNLRDLAKEGERIGLRNRAGHPLRPQQMQMVLRNPFYVGVIRSRRYGLFPGIHVPLVSKPLFDRVQVILSGKFVRRTKRFNFLFRRFIRCATCHRSLVGSERKGHVYYRCPTIECPTTSLREEPVEAAVREVLHEIQFTSDEVKILENEIDKAFADEATLREARRASLEANVTATNARISRLTDLLLDNKIDASEHDEKRSALILERQGLMQDICALDSEHADVHERARRIVELARSAEKLYESADPAKKRQLLEIVISNCTASGKSLQFSLREPFATIAKRERPHICAQFYATDRTFAAEALISLASAWNAKLCDDLEDLLAPQEPSIELAA